MRRKKKVAQMNILLYLSVCTRYIFSIDVRKYDALFMVDMFKKNSCMHLSVSLFCISILNGAK